MSNFKSIPKCSLHKPSGKTRIFTAGKHHYLGKFGSPESRNKYPKLISQQFPERLRLPKQRCGVTQGRAEDSEN